MSTKKKLKTSTWPVGPDPRRASLAATLAWLAWDDPCRRLAPTRSPGTWQDRLLQRAAEEDGIRLSPGAWQNVLTMRAAEDDAVRADLSIAWAKLRPHIARLVPYGTQCKPPNILADNKSKVSPIPPDRFFGPIDLAPEWLLVSGGPYLCFPESEGLLTIIGNVTFNQNALLTAFDAVEPDPNRKACRVLRRKSRWNWEPALAKVFAELFADGIPERTDGRQAKLEKLVASTFSPDKCPAESTIRAKVKETIEASEKRLSRGQLSP